MKVAEHTLSFNIAAEFTRTPGPRYISEGAFSGEEFRERFLKPLFEKAVEEDLIVSIDLDGGYGYAPSFLEESFGGLAREYNPEAVIRAFRWKSDEEPYLIESIVGYIRKARGG